MITCSVCKRKIKKIKLERLSMILSLLSFALLFFVTGLGFLNILWFVAFNSITIYLLIKKPSKNYICIECRR